MADTATSAKKSVQWTQTCTLKLYQMPSEEDRANAWYQPSDYKHFKKEIRAIARVVLAKVVGADALETQLDHSCLGLENFYPVQAKLRIRRRNSAWDSVFDEQESDTHSAESIAEAYQRVSAESQVEAYQQALTNAMPVSTPDKKASLVPGSQSKQSLKMRSQMIARRGQSSSRARVA
jgi:hypothetical protein